MWEVLCGRCSGRLRYYGRGALGGGTLGGELEGSQVSFFVGSPEIALQLFARNSFTTVCQK